MAIFSGSQSVIWLIILLACIVIEVATLGLTTIWFAGGALIAAVLSLLGLPFVVQFIVFVVVSVVLLAFTRPIAVRYFNKDRIRTNTESLIGQQAIVVGEINNLEQTGRITIQGKEWTARTTENGIVLPSGSVVIVRAIDGVKLIVEARKEEGRED